jgi:prophage tail gpP-like protein
LSGTYKSRGGENWSTVARQTTGNDLDASAIKRANPSLREPLPSGVIVQIPMETSSLNGIGEGELEIQVDGTKIGTFDAFEISLAMDAITKGSFVVPNEPETREIFIPFGSQRIQIGHRGYVLCTGRSFSPIPNNSPNEKTLSVGFYSNPGVLETCTPSIEKFPLEWKNALLETIADDLCLEHGINVEFETPTSSRFKRVDIQPGETILPFLANLASQRGLILSSTPDGNLFIHAGKGSKDIISFLEIGKHPTESIAMNINEEKFFSSITGIVQTNRRKKGSKFTVQNPHGTKLVRAYTFQCSDIEAGELETAVQSAAGRMFAEVFQLSVEVATWRNDLDSVYMPGQLVSVVSEQDFVPNPFTFLITQVTFSRISGRHTAQLQLSFPGVFSGEIPEVLPWF